MRHQQPADRDHSHGERRDSRGTQGYAASRALDAPAGAFCRDCGGWSGCLGLEPTIDLFLAHIVEVFREVRRVLRRDGSCFLNMGDSYACSANGRSAAATKAIGDDDRTFRDKPFGTAVGALKPKDMCLLPHRCAIALQEDGWWIRMDHVWAKKNPLPSSVKDRAGLAHEYIFHLTKSARYHWDPDAVREPSKRPRKCGPNALRGQVEIRPRGNAQSITEQSYHPLGRNLRSVLWLATEPLRDEHFAAYPRNLVRPFVLAATSTQCCARCGAPWRRVVDVTYQKGYRSGHLGFRSRGSTDGMRDMSDYPALDRHVETIGWAPSCRCREPLTEPAVVLDPFAGSGTTGIVAAELGRRAICIDMKREYLEIAQRRLEGAQKNANSRRRRVTEHDAAEQPELPFEEP